LHWLFSCICCWRTFFSSYSFLYNIGE
jgi:hypothetical protein